MKQFYTVELDGVPVHTLNSPPWSPSFGDRIAFMYEGRLRSFVIIGGGRDTIAVQLCEV